MLGRPLQPVMVSAGCAFHDAIPGSMVLAGECIKKQDQKDRVRGRQTLTRCRPVNRSIPEGLNRG